VGAARNDDGGSNNEGAAYIFFGSTTLSGTKDTGSADEDVRILGKGTFDFLTRSWLPESTWPLWPTLATPEN